MILFALSLLALGSWQLAGRPGLLATVTVGGGALIIPSRRLIVAVLAGQGAALLGAAVYAVLIAPVPAHDVIGGWLCGGLLGVLGESLRSRRAP